MTEQQLINQDAWRRMTAADTRLPHALLLAGPAGVGKRELADALAARLLCERPRQPHEVACGKCPACLMMASGQHPDFRLLQPDAAAEGDDEVAEGDKKKSSKLIRIQQIREVEEFFYIGGHRGGARVCLIDPAEAMNAVTANALLKILEEPSPSFYFLIISHHWRKLIPTLLSRTRRVMFGRPQRAQAERWLEQQKMSAQAKWLPFFGNAPLGVVGAATSGRLKVLESLVADLLKPQDPLAQAGRWDALVKDDVSLGMEELVTTVQKWLFDLGRCQVGAQPRYFPNQDKALASLAQRISLTSLLQAEKQLAQMKALAKHPLNQRLFLEDLCVRAYRPFNQPAAS